MWKSGRESAIIYKLKISAAHLMSREEIDMKLNACEKTDVNVYSLDITVEAAEFAGAVAKVAARELKKIQIPGFRKGKAPRAMVEKMYGKDVFYEDALELVFSDNYLAAVEESKLDVVGDPFDFNVVSMTLTEGANVTCKVYVKPEVSIEGYKGIEAPKADAEVTDEEVDEEIEKVREDNARFVEVDGRAAADGDIVTIDYLGKLDGEPFDGGSAEDFDLTLGSGMFIPGFEEQVVGHEIGESFVINVSFPDDYGNNDLAGKAVTFDITIKAIKVKELDALDDEFAKDVSEFDTFDEYKADVRKSIAEKKQEKADSDFKNAVLEALAEKLEVEAIPQPMIDAAVADIMNDLDYNLRMNGTSLENYMRITGMSEESFRSVYADRAEKNVRLTLALEKIAALEGFECTDEELEEEYGKIAEAYNVDIERIKSAIRVDTVKGDVIKRKAVDLVTENAVAVAPAEEEAETPADETPADDAE